FASVYSWEPGSDTARRIVSYGVGLWAEQAGPQSVVMDQPTLAVVVRAQRIGLMRSTDPNLNPEEAALFADVGPSAQLVLPLVFKGRTVGLVQLFDINPEREFVSRETALAHTLANQAAIALENAHLVRDLQRSLDEQKAMQSRLVHAARLSALGELSTVVAHQINNPLTTVLGDAEMLVQDIPPDNPAHESAKAILRAGTRAKQVVERLLTMAHMENEMRVQDVNRTIEETLQLIGTSITQQHIALDVHLADNLPLVLAIPGQLEDGWMNLIINARDGITQRGNDGGHIRIASRSVEDGKLVEVTITDNGAGMTAEQVRQAFDPFFTTKPRGKGTGLGLYICRQIVDEHDGNIQIESTPGEGTTVVVTLPTAAEGDRST
ncbi:MAG: GAF domain-containing protein, partial [Chloroflexi bacterium]|nr:GAF domain-containing protein [Chloroflexota bacterium]